MKNGEKEIYRSEDFTLELASGCIREMPPTIAQISPIPTLICSRFKKIRIGLLDWGLITPRYEAWRGPRLDKDL